MAPSWFVLLVVVFSYFFGLLRGSPGDADSVYQWGESKHGICMKIKTSILTFLLELLPKILEGGESKPLLGKVFSLANELQDGAIIFLDEGYSLFLAVIRAFSVRVEPLRVMVATPVFAFLATHILYLNFYEFDYSVHTATLFLLNRILHLCN